MREFSSLAELTSKIRNEQAAIDYFTAIRWRNGAFCPYCGSVKVYHFSDRRTHKCGDCRQRFSIKVGTVFEDSKIPMRKWLIAIWLITSHKKGIASTQLAKDVGVTQKTAWFMAHRLRHAKATKSYNKPLIDVVEADETYIGGKEMNKHFNKRVAENRGGKGKAVVFGMLERNGDVRAFQLQGDRTWGITSKITENVAPGSCLVTDESSLYNALPEIYDRCAVNHSKHEYVRNGFVHTNGIEGVWSLLKRQIYGIHHWVSAKHLSRYVSEMTWRYNLREMGEGERLIALVAGSDGRLTYQGLIA